MSSVALKKRIEEPWTNERVAKFIDLLGFRETTLKSDTNHCVQKSCLNCATEKVTTGDAVKGDKESNGLIENAIHQNHRMLN